MAHAPTGSIPVSQDIQQPANTSHPTSRIITLDTLPTPPSPTLHPMRLRIATALASPTRSPRLRVRGNKYFLPELLDFLEVMERILPIGPLEWETVADLHGKQWPGRDVDSLRRKYTSTHRRKAPTGSPDCPPEVIAAKRVKSAIADKAELTDCAEEYDMEDETDDTEVGAGGVARVGFIEESETDVEPSPQRRRLRVKTRKPEKPDLMGFLVMQMTNDAAARDEERKLRAEERQKLADDRLEAARERSEIAKEKSDDRRQFNMMIASIAQGFFASGRNRKRKNHDSINLLDAHMDDASESTSSDDGNKKMAAKK